MLGRGIGRGGVVYFLFSHTLDLTHFCAFYSCWFCSLELSGTFFLVPPSFSHPRNGRPADLTWIHVCGLALGS